ncbi:NfeD family protein [Paramaledivibacter caminithermalis]|jgi:membrane protein implicated in regulation of membrane protease activity|uniref:Membrane protein implicated in regulation of membrane protease activity n=1 Tax=Paramaledivibacter caminithermalis (strain DSM 15212 / CIP 107654 / DViRD3) TaxID=1121301 RepID=A0A1M6RL44_PARC5|nr:NfeD family protein [Paramaledivibacter caminithermalis]SHK33067.1 Membrane protein implicated in regulation of membrane protease activity [Paramaledivibacter caminithermalis DSM 15212]
MFLIYKITFITGILYAVATLILGHLFDSLDFDGDVDFPILSFIPIKPITIVTFITVFGGVGIMATLNGFSTVVSLIISLAIAYITTFIIYKLLVLPLFKAQNTSAASQKDLIGMTANVTSKIMENGFGQITYTNKGNTYSSPAKSINNKAIERGTEVVIISIDNNVFYVETSEELFSEI